MEKICPICDCVLTPFDKRTFVCDVCGMCKNDLTEFKSLNYILRVRESYQNEIKKEMIDILTKSVTVQDNKK